MQSHCLVKCEVTTLKIQPIAISENSCEKQGYMATQAMTTRIGWCPTALSCIKFHSQFKCDYHIQSTYKIRDAKTLIILKAQRD